MTPAQVDKDWERRISKHGHCTGFVRVGPEQNDLLVGHTTWSDYSTMTRMFKYYHFSLPGSEATANVIGFSSYPGCISSTDDWYQMDNGLVVMDTSLEVIDGAVYDRVDDKVPPFMHVMAVNRMAATGSHWASLMQERSQNSNSAQWLVVDYNLFVPGQRVPGNTLWAVEQVPGLTHKADVSEVLNLNGYWASYNRPYFPDVRALSGHKEAEREYGPLYSYANNPRASIFKKIGPNVADLFSMRSAMNRNTFPKEGTTPSSPSHAISARYDLDPDGGAFPNGGIDAKVTNRCLFRMLQCQAVSGPTHDTQPVFRWTADNGLDIFPGWPHIGMPDIFNFDWVQMSPSGPLPALADTGTC